MAREICFLYWDCWENLGFIGFVEKDWELWFEKVGFLLALNISVKRVTVVLVEILTAI